MIRFSELLNVVWGLEGCPLKGQPVHMNRSLRFCFGGATVLVASLGDQVSFYTTEGDVDEVLRHRSSNRLTLLLLQLCMLLLTITSPLP